MRTRSRVGAWSTLMALGCIAGCAAPVGEPGVAGSEGRSALVKVSEEGPGASCTLGGQRVDVGVDDNDDGVLEASEVEKTSYVCDALPGAPGPGGAAGADGKDGVDGAPGAVGKDGIDGAPGADGKDGLDGAPGADGKDGLDGKDGVDGAPGPAGPAGADGKDGYSALIRTTAISPGAECSAGGQKIEAGVDDGRNTGIAGDGILQAGEITSTATVCAASGGGAHLIDANGVDMGRVLSSDGMIGLPTLLSPTGYLYAIQSYDLSVMTYGLYYTTTDCSGTPYSWFGGSYMFQSSDRFAFGFGEGLYRSVPGTFAERSVGSANWGDACSPASGTIKLTEVTPATAQDLGLTTTAFTAPIHVE